jgi:hypothetical protein
MKMKDFSNEEQDMGKSLVFHGKLLCVPFQVTTKPVEQNTGHYDLNLGQATALNFRNNNHANDKNVNCGDRIKLQRINWKSNNGAHPVEHRFYSSDIVSIWSTT